MFFKQKLALAGIMHPVSFLSFVVHVRILRFLFLSLHHNFLAGVTFIFSCPFVLNSIAISFPRFLTSWMFSYSFGRTSRNPRLYNEREQHTWHARHCVGRASRWRDRCVQLESSDNPTKMSEKNLFLFFFKSHTIDAFMVWLSVRQCRIHREQTT